MLFSYICDHNINMFKWLIYCVVNNISISTSFNNLFKFVIILEYHINLHIKVSKMQKCDNGSNKIDIKMTSMYNKLWKKQDDFF
jgi:hypothetical protein